MSSFYNLSKVEEIAQGDTTFVKLIVSTFLEEMPKDTAALKQSYEDTNYEQVYQLVHKMKPTVELFGLGVLDEIIFIQDWGKFKKSDVCIKKQMVIVIDRIQTVVEELKEKFN